MNPGEDDPDKLTNILNSKAAKLSLGFQTSQNDSNQKLSNVTNKKFGHVCNNKNIVSIYHPLNDELSEKESPTPSDKTKIKLNGYCQVEKTTGEVIEEDSKTFSSCTTEDSGYMLSQNNCKCSDSNNYSTGKRSNHETPQINGNLSNLDLVCKCKESTKQEIDNKKTLSNLSINKHSVEGRGSNKDIHNRKHVKLKSECGYIETTSHDVDQNNYSEILTKVILNDKSDDNSNISSKIAILNCDETLKHTDMENELQIYNKIDKKEISSDFKPKNSIVSSNSTKYHSLCDLYKLKHVLKSLQRLAYIYESLEVFENGNHMNDEQFINTLLVRNFDQEIPLIKVKHSKKFKKCLPKQMRSSPTSGKNNMRIKSTSSEDGLNIGNDLKERYFKCEWLECKHQYRTTDKLSNHMKKEHIASASKNEVFVCLWKDCRFVNQPSCSFKWLSKHALSHCDVKPFKCVLHGCDMAFASQSGLARHVPTHFNENKVRRTCVLTSRYTAPSNFSHFVSRPLCNYESDQITEAPVSESESEFSTRLQHQSKTIGLPSKIYCFNDI